MRENVYIYREKIDLSFLEISTGETVVVKPNLIRIPDYQSAPPWESVVTSPDLIRRVVEDVCKKLNGTGKVTICDAPQTESNFIDIENKLSLNKIASSCTERYKTPVEVLDLRNEEWRVVRGVISERRLLPGDSEGTISFNLGKDSLFYKYQGEGRYYGADYDAGEVNRHHSGETQEYLICATPIKADVFINIPKMKTHKKSGVTLCLKNLVGINADKNWLPHHTVGSPEDGGDQFPNMTIKRRFENYAFKMVTKLALRLPWIGTRIAQIIRRPGLAIFGDNKKVIRSGNWHGNDTIWRMILDLNRCLLYGNPDGTLRSSVPKRYYGIVDGSIGMEGNGPLDGESVKSNCYICGTNPVAVDMVAARVMGFDWRNIPVIKNALNLTKYPIADFRPTEVQVICDMPGWSGNLLDIEDNDFLSFRPSPGWLGNIEYKRS